MLTNSVRPQAQPPAPRPMLTSLSDVAEGQGLAELATRLREVEAVAHDDLATCADALEQLARRDDVRPDSVVVRSALHLLGLGGKRLRPMLVALSARCGGVFDERARDLAVAAELVHNATLLHDDVVDVGDVRRGAPTARTLYGNAASIYAGDWLLVDALRRVRRAGVPGTFETLLSTLDALIEGEALQLEGRGRLRADRETYFAVVRGKTASLFRWACASGAIAGGLGETGRDALAAYGEHLGTAFQIVDDVLDFAGQQETTGKELFADVREGKATYPLVVAMEREPELRALLEPIAQGLAAPDADQIAQLMETLERTGAIDEARRLAHEHVARALEALSVLPESPARSALETVALATIYRNH